MKRLFGKYELRRRIAVGGMAEIFLANAEGIEGFAKQVVIKRMLPGLVDDPEFMTMFVDEAKLAARLTHPEIVQVYELGVFDQRYFIAMEYVPGVDLSSLLKRMRNAGEILAPGAAVAIAAASLRALHYAHEKKDEDGAPLDLVHRDVSPQNILLSVEGMVKLTDFGIAKARSRTSRTRTGTLKGKLAYMSPEQAEGLNVDRRSDLFALALVLYEMLTGARPYEGSDEVQAIELARLAHIPPLQEALVGVPLALSRVMQKALARVPDERFATARDFLSALLSASAAWTVVADATELSALVERAMRHPSAEDDDLDGELSEHHAEDTSDRIAAQTMAPREDNARAANARTIGRVGVAAVAVVGFATALMWRAHPREVVSTPIPTPVAITPPIATPMPEAAPPVVPRRAVTLDTRGHGSGTLTLNSIPWSFVWIDGKKLSVSTPLRNFTIATGIHKVKLECPGAQRTNEFSIDIAPHQNVTKIVDFTE